VNDELCPRNELLELGRHRGKEWLITELIPGQAMYLRSALIDLSLWVEIHVHPPARGTSVLKLDRANFNDAMPLLDL
jgi:hypothetical protein